MVLLLEISFNSFLKTLSNELKENDHCYLITDNIEKITNKDNDLLYEISLTKIYQPNFLVEEHNKIKLQIFNPNRRKNYFIRSINLQIDFITSTINQKKLNKFLSLIDKNYLQTIGD